MKNHLNIKKIVSADCLLDNMDFVITAVLCTSADVHTEHVRRCEDVADTLVAFPVTTYYKSI